LLLQADHTYKMPDCNSKGFSILEIVVVVALMGLLAAVAGPRIGSGIRGAETRTSVRRFASALRAARTIAVTHQAQVLVVADMGTNTCEFRIRTTRKSRETSRGDYENGNNTSSGDIRSVSELFQKPFELTGDVKFLEFSTGDLPHTGFQGAIMFLPQGNSTGGGFTIGRMNGPYYSVTTDAITGRIHVNRL
jgi:type II secretion system protein H